jgi:cytosine/adenosine deaminase-related metal-dependent hydrolase
MNASRLMIEGCAVATADPSGSEYGSGHLVVEGSRIVAVGEGPAPEEHARDARKVDGGGCLATPGLVNCHHHLYQWATRGLAQQATLFEWLVALYPVWALIDEEIERSAARAGLAALASSGCTTTTDHHYVFPRGVENLLEVEIQAAKEIGLRFHPCRGSMDLGRSRGGLPPDEVVEDRDEILAASEEAIYSFHDPAPDSMLRVALAPCSPFSVTPELMAETAEFARKKGVRLHTHLAETKDEEEFCLEQYGVRPVEYLEDLGWLGDDVWLAHCIHLNEHEIMRFGETGTGVAHCPSSNARLAGGPAALTAREALELATIYGARCLGRETEIGSLEVGKLADVALWRVDNLAHAGIEDPVTALVLGPAPRVELLLVNGEPIVQDAELRTADELEIAREIASASRRLAEKMEVAS